jgi:hypothetical protein
MESMLPAASAASWLAAKLSRSSTRKACLLKNTARLLRGQAVAANLCDYRSRQHQSGAS